MCREERYLRLGEAVIVFYEINHALCGVEQYSVGGLERGLKGWQGTVIKRATSKQLLTGVFIYIQAWYLIGPSITIDSGIYPT